MMKKMKVVLIAVLATLFIGVSNNADAQFFKFRKKKKQEVSVAKKDSTENNKYDKLLKDATVQDGMFKIITKKKEGKTKMYFEIPKNIMHKDFLLFSRLSKVSSTWNATAGRVPTDPILLKFSSDEKNVFIHKVINTQTKCDKNSEIYESFKRNYSDPLWLNFKIEAFNKDSSACVIDMTDFFIDNRDEIEPFCPFPYFGKMLKVSGAVNKAQSGIINTKAFDKNVKIRSKVAYSVSGAPYTVELTRNILMLPDEPMRERRADARIGYFYSNRTEFTEKEDQAQNYWIIHKWNLQPKDLAAYKAGEIVEPVEPIVWYVDTAIPSKWRGYIRQGIEDWNEAFKEIGFKNVMIAKDYPTKEEDPDFDPDDIKNNCYRYSLTGIRNSMGPSYVDPRSGEIICADVHFYSNVTDLLHKWRFVQTAAVDPRVRNKKSTDELMGESLRYVAAHEVGHTLGLLHNFGASSAFPVDSLRSPKFTQKYGTTPSIMDYARYNYVAQPGDYEKGVKLTPPRLGVYDKFAIKWGYTPIYDAETSKDEYKTLNKWIIDSAKDRKLHFGPQLGNTVDPEDQSEDLGDDVVKATEYGIKNLKVIMNNLGDWTTEKYDSYDVMKEFYATVVSQFERYITHLLYNVGGRHINHNVVGDGQKALEFVPRAHQKKAVKCILKNLYDFPNWIRTKETSEMAGDLYYVEKEVTKYFKPLMHERIAFYLTRFEIHNPKSAYSYREYSDDIFKFIFKKSMKGQSLNNLDMQFQITYIESIIGIQAYDKLFRGVEKSTFTQDTWKKLSDFENDYSFSVDKEYSFVSDEAVKAKASPVLYHNIFKAYDLLKRLQKTAPKKDRTHYRLLYLKLNKFINN